ncbi:hypothetical protein CN072_29395 [Sinorhizobium meliloti]|nr:hypothetical protein CN072_29395 [Sinorhizobium meliloti]
MMPTELESLVLSISADTAQVRRALKRMESDSKDTARNVENAFDNVVPFDRMQQGFSRSAKAMAGDAQNLRFQFNDLFTQISSGTGVAQAFAQQAGQIGQVLGSAGGLRGGVALVGQALAGMLNPLYAIPIAISIALPAIQSFFSETEEGGEAAEKAIGAQRELIRQLANEWGAALPALQKYNQELERQEGIAKAISGLDQLFEQTKKEAQDALGSVDAEVDKILDTFGRFPKLAAPIAEVRAEWDELQRKIAEGRATIEDVERFQAKFNATVAKLPLQSARNLAGVFQNELIPQITAAVARMREFANESARLKEQEAQAKFNLAPIGASTLDLTPVTAAGGKFFPSAAEAEKAGQETARAYASGVRQYLAADKPLSHITELDAEFSRRLAAFLAAAQEQAGQIVINSGARSIERQAQLWQEALKKYGSAEAARKWVAPPGKSMHNQGRAADLGYETEAVKAWAHANAEAYGLVYRLKNEDWHIELAGAEATQQATAATRDSTAAMSEKATATQSAIQPTQQLTEAQRAQAASAEQQAQAAAQLAAQYTQLGQTAVSSFVSELRAGASAGDAFAAAIDRVIDGLVDMALQSMFSKNALGGLFGGSGGLFGGGGMGVGLYHQGGKVGSTAVPRRTVPAAMFANAPRLHNGLRAGEFPAILQRGETVIPRSSAMTRGAVAAAAGDTNIGDISITVPTQVAATTEQGKALGLQINRAVQKILIDEQRGGGILSPGRRLS